MRFEDVRGAVGAGCQSLVCVKVSAAVQMAWNWADVS